MSSVQRNPIKFNNFVHQRLGGWGEEDKSNKLLMNIKFSTVENNVQINMTHSSTSGCLSN